MKLSQIKQIKAFCETLHSNPDWRDVVKNIEKIEDDFEIDGVRFINDDKILATLAFELACDPYILGSFNAWAIADATKWPVRLIEIAQKNGAHEQIGKEMGSNDVMELAKIYVGEDGYGHHFNHYDGEDEELFINGQHYHVFDNR